MKKVLFWTGTSEVLQEQLLLVDIPTLQTRVYSSIAGEIYIGGQKVTGQTREILRDEARYLQSSTFWEIVNAAIIDEAAKLALQATEMTQVHKAQMLKAWAFRMQEAVKLLTV